MLDGPLYCVSKMLAEREINIKVATALGWKIRQVEEHILLIEDDRPLPDYCDDLNACKEFEDRMKAGDVLFVTYINHLIDVVPTDYIQRKERIVLATAKQRCLAYLKTMQLIK